MAITTGGGVGPKKKSTKRTSSIKGSAKRKLGKAIAQAAYEPKLTNVGNYSLTGKSPSKAKAYASGVRKGLKNVKSRVAKRGAAKSKKR